MNVERINESTVGEVIKHVDACLEEIGDQQQRIKQVMVQAKERQAEVETLRESDQQFKERVQQLRGDIDGTLVRIGEAFQHSFDEAEESDPDYNRLMNDLHVFHQYTSRLALEVVDYEVDDIRKEIANDLCIAALVCELAPIERRAIEDPRGALEELKEKVILLRRFPEESAEFRLASERYQKAESVISSLVGTLDELEEAEALYRRDIKTLQAYPDLVEMKSTIVKNMRLLKEGWAQELPQEKMRGFDRLIQDLEKNIVACESQERGELSLDEVRLMGRERFTVVEVPPSGNCLFDASGIQLGLRHDECRRRVVEYLMSQENERGSGTTTDTIREDFELRQEELIEEGQLAEYYNAWLKENREKVDAMIGELGKEPDDFYRYCGYMSEPGKWGGDMELVVLHKMSGRPLILFDEEHREPMVFGEELSDAIPIILERVHGDHYRALLVSREPTTWGEWLSSFLWSKE